MTFVNELIPEEEKAKFTFDVYTRADGNKPTLWKWTIDHERNIYLVTSYVRGGGYEGTPEDYDFVLNINGAYCRFSAEQHLSGNKREGIVMTWFVHSLDIPFIFHDRARYVRQIIIEALDAHGWLYDRSRLSDVIIHFNVANKSQERTE